MRIQGNKDLTIGASSYAKTPRTGTSKHPIIDSRMTEKGTFPNLFGQSNSDKRFRKDSRWDDELSMEGNNTSQGLSAF